MFCFGCFLTRYLIFFFVLLLFITPVCFSISPSLFVYLCLSLLLCASVTFLFFLYVLYPYTLLFFPLPIPIPSVLFVSNYAEIIFHTDIQHSNLSHQSLKVCGNRPNSNSSFPWQLKCLASKGFFCRVPHPVHDDILWALRIGVKTH